MNWLIVYTRVVFLSKNVMNYFTTVLNEVLIVLTVLIVYMFTFSSTRSIYVYLRFKTHATSIMTLRGRSEIIFIKPKFSQS